MKGPNSIIETKLVLLSRKLQYTSRIDGIWLVILPSHTLKSLQITHNSTFVLKSTRNDKVVCIKVHSAVEYNLEYSFLKPPNAIVSEELLLSLDVPSNEPVSVTLSKPYKIGVASTVELTYLEYHDMKEDGWKKIGESNSLKGIEDVQPSINLNAMNSLKCLKWFNGDNKGDLKPPIRWWKSLLMGEMDHIIKVGLSGTILCVDNVIPLSLKGFLTRFRISAIQAAEEEENKDHKKLMMVTDSCKIKVRFQPLHDTNGQSWGKISEKPKLGGLRIPLDILKWHVIYPLIYNERYSKLGIFPPAGVLLYGPPGSGKTFLAKCMKHNYRDLFDFRDESDSEIHFKMVQSTDLLSSIVGKTEENITNLFKECEHISKSGKCICFIDEIDVLCQKREFGRDANRRSVTSFLNNMDGIDGKANPLGCSSNYVIIGMTNDLDSIDIALRRPGRFDLEIEIGVPTSDERLDILKTMLETVSHNLSLDNMAYINDFCQAFVGADIKALISNASWSHLRRMMDSLETKGPFVDVDSALTMDDFLQAIKYTKPSALKELYIQIPNVRWGDIGGYEEVKNCLKECVEYPRTYNMLYEKLHVQAPKGILLYGPPGCSKTLMAKAVATESHMNFISVKGPELLSKWVGESERAIRQLFKKARTNSPCVVFFDEMDSISVSREMPESGGVNSRVLSQILSEMDGINPLNQVVVVGATNRPDIIDPALLRPGRFDRLVYIPLPDLDARASIFKIYLGKLPTDGLDLEEISLELAKQTENYSGAEIAMICKESALCALRDSIKQHSQRLKNKGESFEGIFERLSIGQNDVIPISCKHLTNALSQIKPRTKRETVTFYEDYRKQHPF